MRWQLGPWVAPALSPTVPQPLGHSPPAPVCAAGAGAGSKRLLGPVCRAPGEVGMKGLCGPSSLLQRCFQTFKASGAP